MNISKRTLAVLFIFLSGWLAEALAELPPEVTEVSERNVEAMGGRDRIEEIEAIRMSGATTIAAMGMEASYTMYQLYPHKVFTRMSIEGMGDFIQAHDGETGWAKDPMMGFRLLGEGEIRELKRQSSLKNALEFDRLYSSGERLPDVTREGTRLHVLSLHSSVADDVETHYYSAETGLLQRLEMTSDMGEMGEVPATMVVRETMEVGGIVFPSRLEVINPAMTISMQFDEIELDPEIDESLFAPSP